MKPETVNPGIEPLTHVPYHGRNQRLEKRGPGGMLLAMLITLSLTHSALSPAQQNESQMLHNPEHASHSGTGHSMQNNNGSMNQITLTTSHPALPKQTGQSAFAAIAEIVALLDADPNTDWTSVDIEALRVHLVDMDRITLQAQAETIEVDEQRIQFRVTGTGETLTAIRNMAPAHASVVQAMTNWSINTTDQKDGVTISIETDDKQALTRLKALGFHGFLTIGAHHQAHHLQMARGLGH